ncbi:hypothetical protein FNB79_11965 [Formosa sediminum]|uniref:Uncharacterized protein n=1 Tax=Formosa sediminum TaxID=2594004 RepID=A0A516GSZ9_9FLAO|nr:hypothetical protein [Formosa sediminum]QDO94250.1 hypothetical protein FNB79_09790 [Formosa sediminum]QDO94643.1 hypothetical protein FNB79_11965 [Formosa sediminum]
MREQITVDKAINRGHLIVNIPVFITIIGCPALALFLSKQNLIPGWGIGIAFLIGFVLAWLIWSFMITKWRIWAFENVRNVHELKKRAIQEKLIWRDGNIFEKTEIRDNKDKLKLKELEKKFEKEDEYKEDYTVPSLTKIHYSKTTNLIEMGIMLLCLGLGVYLIITSDSYIKGTIFSLIGGYYAIKEFRQATNNHTQITICNKGIRTVNVEFKNWKEIRNEEVIYINTGKRYEAYLYYKFKGGSEKIKIGDFDKTPKEMENLLRTYRIRNNKNYR